MKGEDLKFIAYIFFGIAILLFIYAESLTPCEWKGGYWCMQKVARLQNFSIGSFAVAIFFIFLSISNASSNNKTSTLTSTNVNNQYKWVGMKEDSSYQPWEYDIGLDFTGLFSPLPLIKSKAEINTMKRGQLLFIISSDYNTVNDIKTYINKATDELLQFQEKDEKFYFLIQKN
tara:strand:+ start:1021 stop:1542 length:522 start_codon:yes stop_codon:yes gene_type:complete